MVDGEPDRPVGRPKAGSVTGPDGTTLAGLCWNFVKHSEKGKNPVLWQIFRTFWDISPLDGTREWSKMLSVHAIPEYL